MDVGLTGAVTGALIAPLIKTVEDCGIQAIVNQIGYCIYYKKKVKSLDEKVKALEALRKQIQEKVTAAKKNVDSIDISVKTWLEKVKKEMEEDEIMKGLMNFSNSEEAIKMFNNDECCKGCCCLITRNKIGGEAQKKIVVIEGLLNDGKRFGDVSYPCADLVASAITQSISTDGNVAFASRESIMNEIMSALRDEEIYSVGIYGMGGVGKTMLKNWVHKQVVVNKLFDIVITINCSQNNISVKKIQDDIAQILGFKKLDGIDNKTTRANLLLRRLKEEENILVILDNLWSMNRKLLFDVGIPYRYKGCKLLITTRIRRVCSSIRIQKIVEVKCLSASESWHLFKLNAGNLVDSYALKPVATEIVKECGGLPIALVTVGSALHNKSEKSAWDDTADQFKKSNYSEIEEMTSEVYNSIKLSYDFLGNDILKRCFLMCCLFPEGKSVHVDDLLIYAIGDEVIRRDLETLMEVRFRIRKAFTELDALGLLICDEEIHDQTFSAKMHDIIRDVAILIASGDGYRFYVREGRRLQKWPDAGFSSIRECSRLSLIHGNITVLPDQPELPRLSSLSLRNNRYLHKIPDRFFENMNALRSLDIHGIHISTLPSSFSSLANLRSLDMGFCEFHSQLNTYALGELKNLEILNLASLGLSMISLPKEIGGLPRLKWLNLSGNYRLTVPPGIISRLTCLEYMNMDDSFERWEVGEIRGEGSRVANLDEIASLACLQHVILKATLGFSQSLKMYTKHTWWSASESLCCDLAGGSLPVCNSIRILVGKAEQVTLFRCSNLKSMASLHKSSRFNNTKCLQVLDCKEMEYVLNSSALDNAFFTALLEIYLSSLPNLKEVFHGLMCAKSSLENLRHIEVENCLNLVCIYSPKVLGNEFKNLEVLKVTYCRRLKEVFPIEEASSSASSNGPKQEHGNTLFPRLRELLLEDLTITSIWNQAIFSLGNLKSVEVIRCSELKYLFTPAIVTTLQQLEILVIIGCKKLVTIVGSDDELTVEGKKIMNNHFQTITTFPNLRIFEFRICSLKVFCPPVTDMNFPLEILVPEEEEKEEVQQHQQQTFNRSEHDGEDKYDCYYDCDDKRALILENVQYMEDIWGGIIPIQSFLNLTEAKIIHCGGLKHLIPIQVLRGGGLSQLKKLDVRYCKRLEAVIETSDDDVIVVADPQNQTILENLEILMIWECERLKHLLPMKLLVQGGGLPKLEVLKVGNCAKIKMICYGSIHDGDDNTTVIPAKEEVFPRLGNLLKVGSCAKIKMICYGRSDDNINKTVIPATVEMFPRLRNLSLTYLPQLSSFHQ